MIDFHYIHHILYIIFHNCISTDCRVEKLTKPVFTELAGLISSLYQPGQHKCSHRLEARWELALDTVGQYFT